MNKIKSDLMVPLWELYNINSMSQVIFSEKTVEKLIRSKSLIDRKAMYEALIWANDNPNFEFESIMENAPVINKLPFSNAEIYEYLMKFKAFMEKDNGILTEESKPKV